MSGLSVPQQKVDYRSLSSLTEIVRYSGLRHLIIRCRILVLEICRTKDGVHWMKRYVKIDTTSRMTRVIVYTMILRFYGFTTTMIAKRMIATDRCGR